jgi:hypothetical protein
MWGVEMSRETGSGPVYDGTDLRIVVLRVVVVPKLATGNAYRRPNCANRGSGLHDARERFPHPHTLCSAPPEPSSVAGINAQPACDPGLTALCGR